MAKENETGARQQTAQQPQAPQARPCPQDCRRCGVSQQIFCTTKMLFDLSKTQQAISQKIEVVENTVADIQAQLQPKEQDVELAIPFAE